MRHVARIIQAEGTSVKALWQQGHDESKHREEGCREQERWANHAGFRGQGQELLCVSGTWGSTEESQVS